ncbi:MAG: DUF5018 domain-containing protein [Bacteroidales bacterium]|jgi:hypothetical protein|nr:DUF5018 domain-containing protein [Bacteroidales bacterium]
MKKIYLILMIGLAAVLFNACESPDYVDPTVTRKGITSLKAYFTTGDYSGKTAANYVISDASEVSDYVIPVPYYYPESSDNTTDDYMPAMKIVASIANNCKIEPELTVLDLTKKNEFTFFSPDGTSRKITITGKQVHSDACAIKSFILPDNGITGVIDEDAKTISLISADDLSACKAEVTLSPHATISPDPSKALDYSSDVDFTVTADDGTTTARYTVTKQIPDKIPSGIRSGSDKELYTIDITDFGGIADANAIHPTLASISNYLIIDYGDGSTPIYLNKATGTKLGTISLGSADPSGAVVSDLGGNMLICNYAASGSTFNIYKTNSVTADPELYISYNNQSGLHVGSRMHIQGDLASDAIITATFDGPYSQNFLRWVVSGGVVGEPEMVTAGTPSQWSDMDANCKVAACTTNANDGYFLGYYDSGNDNVYYFNGNNVIENTVGPKSDGSAWGYNNSFVDVRTFNNIRYLMVYTQGYWPDWGLPATIYLYDVSSMSNFTGTVDSSPALYYSKVLGAYTTIGYAASPRTGDILMLPSSDGFKLDLFYVDNTSLGLGCVEFDCIDK